MCCSPVQMLPPSFLGCDAISPQDLHLLARSGTDAMFTVEDWLRSQGGAALPSNRNRTGASGTGTGQGAGSRRGSAAAAGRSRGTSRIVTGKLAAVAPADAAGRSAQSRTEKPRHAGVDAPRAPGGSRSAELSSGRWNPTQVGAAQRPAGRGQPTGRQLLSDFEFKIPDLHEPLFAGQASAGQRRRSSASGGDNALSSVDAMLESPPASFSELLTTLKARMGYGRQAGTTPQQAGNQPHAVPATSSNWQPAAAGLPFFQASAHRQSLDSTDATANIRQRPPPPPPLFNSPPFGQESPPFPLLLSPLTGVSQTSDHMFRSPPFLFGDLEIPMGTEPLETSFQGIGDAFRGRPSLLEPLSLNLSRRRLTAESAKKAPEGDASAVWVPMTGEPTAPAPLHISQAQYNYRTAVPLGIALYTPAPTTIQLEVPQPPPASAGISPSSSAPPAGSLPGSPLLLYEPPVQRSHHMAVRTTVQESQPPVVPQPAAQRPLEAADEARGSRGEGDAAAEEHFEPNAGDASTAQQTRSSRQRSSSRLRSRIKSLLDQL